MKYEKHNYYFGIRKGSIYILGFEKINNSWTYYNIQDKKHKNKGEKIGIIFPDFVLLFTKQMPFFNFDKLFPLLDKPIVLDNYHNSSITYINGKIIGIVDKDLIEAHNKRFKT